MQMQSSNRKKRLENLNQRLFTEGADDVGASYGSTNNNYNNQHQGSSNDMRIRKIFPPKFINTSGTSPIIMAETAKSDARSL